LSDRVSGSGDACRRDRSVPLPAFHTLAPALIDQPVELAQANLFILEQPAQRMELDRVMLAQHFGRSGELNRTNRRGQSRTQRRPGAGLWWAHKSEPGKDV